MCAGVSAAFAVKLFKSWINEKDINSVAVSLRKVGMDNRLMVAAFWICPLSGLLLRQRVNSALTHRSSFLPTNGAVSIFLSISPTPG